MSLRKKGGTAAMIDGAVSVGGGMRRLELLSSTTETAFPFLGTTEDSGYPPFREGSRLQPGARVALPIKLVAENPANPRVFYPEQEFKELKDSLAQAGQQTAVLVYPANEQGLFVLKSGHRRTRALRAMGRTEVKAEIVPAPGDFFQEYREARDINRQHQEHSHFDDAVRFREFLDKSLVTDQKELAEQMGVSEAQMTRLLSLGKLPLAVLRAMAERPSVFGVSVAYAVYRYWTKESEDEAKALAAIERIASGKLSARQLEREFVEADSRTKPPGTRERALSRASLAGLGTGDLKAFEGKLVLHLEGLTPAVRDNLYRKILATFQDAGLEVSAAGQLGPAVE